MDARVSHLKARRRFMDHNPLGHPIVLADDHPAVREGRTLFPSRVIEHPARILKSGEHSRKIGSHVTKGKWAGMPIYTLTLEERATCPRACAHWNDCYGNHMHFPHRHKEGEALQNQLDIELRMLAQANPKGFVVRLHVLGDFYSVRYVCKWAYWMREISAMHVFGYTARDPLEEIGVALQEMRNIYGRRWWIRWSERDANGWLSTGDTGIICPAQTGKTDCCGTCGLCWTAKKPIRFLLH